METNVLRKNQIKSFSLVFFASWWLSFFNH